MKNITFFLKIVLTILLVSAFLAKTSGEEKSHSLHKSKSTENYSKFNINNISTFIFNNGWADHKPDGNSGLEFPKGSNKTAVYHSGLVWGGKVNGRILVGGSTFSSGLLGGKILEDGTPQDPTDPSVRVYRVRPDYKYCDLESEIDDENKTDSEIRNQYKKDWNEWPALEGAPYYDKNNNGTYEPNIDIPGILGADQTLWYVANDLDSNQAKQLYGSPTLGVEMQVTVWGYKNHPELANMIFKKYILINKSHYNFNDTYLSIWADPDIGDASDDFVGCDTTLNLGFVYNSTNEDSEYGNIIPAIGFNLLQGARTKDGHDLSMTSFPFQGKNDPVYNDPSLGEYERGTLEFYKLMQGLISSNGEPYIDPFTGETELYTLAGDPVTKEGWTDGIITNGVGGDRRLAMNSGPFTMAPGDTQEVIIAQIVANADVGAEYLDAITQLREYSKLAKLFHDQNFYMPTSLSLQPLQVEATELDKEIILSWYNDENINLIENQTDSNYYFQGYKIYQFPNSSFNINEAVEYAVFDLYDGVLGMKYLENISTFYNLGHDTGIKRHISIKQNSLDKDRPIYDGSEYYFGVSYYSLANNKAFPFSPAFIESTPTPLILTPQSPKPGNFYAGKYGEYLDVIRLSGESYISPSIIIVDPTKLNGKHYNVKFEQEFSQADSNNFNIRFTLIDEDNNYLIDNEEIIIQNDLKSAFPFVIDGFEIEPFDKNYFHQLNFTGGEEFTFTTPKSIINDYQLAKEQVLKINVFPNPYYGNNLNETNNWNKYVTFSHLPTKATIRIFNLAGQHVVTINKNDDSQFIRWNLTNGRGFYVPSGIFIAHIDMPDLGTSKILKIAIILETVIPDFF